MSEQRLRLRAAHGRAGAVLRRYAGSGEEVSVTGYIQHVECTTMAVVEAHAAHTAGAAQD